MKRLIILIIWIALSSCCFKTFGQEYRTGLISKFELIKNLEIAGSIQRRFIHQENLRVIADIFETEVEYGFLEHLSGDISYRFNNPYNDYIESFDLEDKHRYTLGVSYKTDLSEFLQLSTQMRFQDSDFANPKSKQYLRNKTILKHSISKLFKPYYGFALYYRLNKKELTDFRFYIGNQLKITEKIDIEYYYMLEKRLDKIRTEYILGLDGVYKF